MRTKIAVFIFYRLENIFCKNAVFKKMYAVSEEKRALFLVLFVFYKGVVNIFIVAIGLTKLFCKVGNARRRNLFPRNARRHSAIGRYCAYKKIFGVCVIKLVNKCVNNPEVVYPSRHMRSLL